MAEAILYGVAQKMIENLGSQIFKEIGSLWGVKDEFEKIKNTVSTIRDVLLDAAEQQSHNHQVRDWLENLKDAVYDADDLLGEFSTEAMRRSTVSKNKIAKQVRTFFSSSNPLAFRLEMSSKIKAMRKKLDAIAEDRGEFHLKEYHAEPHVSVSTNRETHSFVLDEKVIGREEDKRAIIELLLESNVEDNLSVIPIVGIGGLGKTTLAQYVYNDEKVKKYFELKMWVCVSDNFELKIIVEKIIASATGNAPINLEIDQLQIQLREKIHNKKYLLVLDDVWTEDREKWLELKYLLMGGSKGSKIIITTRYRLVAEITETVSPYFLKGLCKIQAWLLFEQVAFRKLQETNNPKLETIGREIVDMCQGVPLAIKSIGSMLYFKEKEFEWSCVKNNILANVTEGNDILPTLKLSYDNLPTHLKSCLAYCSLFPKDYKMDKKTIIQLWMAQGFIPSLNGDQQLEDVGDEYFNDLLWRSFFEEVTMELGEIKYKMHDLIHDLAQSVARADCTRLDLDGKNINEKIRHVSCPFSIDSSFMETSRLFVKAKTVRTFLLTIGEYEFGALDESMLNKLILSFRCLRALDLHKLKISRVPNSVGKLIHLKYLDLSHNESIITLPNSITRLWNLHILKLERCKNLKELPRDIKELVSLRHLINNNCDALSDMPCGLGKMTCLQTLPLFVVSKDPPSIGRHIGGLGKLNRLNNLRGTLKIAHLERLEEVNSESKAANLREKQHLEGLSLNWSQVDNNDYENILEGLQPHQNLKYLDVSGFGGVRFSSWLSLLINLVHLNLQCQRCRHLPPLSQLPSLKRLSLLYMEDLEYISDNDITEEVTTSSAASTTFFPSLNFLKICECPNLKGWWRRNFVATSASRPDHQQLQRRQSLPSFPRLSSLQIQSCPYLTSMPLFPYLEEQLSLDEVSGKPLQQTMAASISHLSPFSNLKSMHLINIRDIIYFPGLNMSSLKSLEISKCPRLASVSRAVRYLTSLEELAIHDCEELNPSNDMNDDGLEWQRLNCLRSLTFEGLPKLKSLPAGLLHVSTMQKLVISNCPNLMTLPEWISKLTSLEELRIVKCPNLISLPDGMHHLKSLQKLIINDCPYLEKKCEKEIGEDWLKIAHVPNLCIT